MTSVRARSRGDELAGGALDQPRAERVRELVRVVQETGVGEVTVEEAGTRISVRRTVTEEPSVPELAPAAQAESVQVEEPLEPPASDGFVRVEAPMVGTFYRASEPGAPAFVQEGDAVGLGDTLCILEAMKLMNHVKAEVEGVVRVIHAENGAPVEFGQLLFELEPVLPRPLDAV